MSAATIFCARSREVLDFFPRLPHALLFALVHVKWFDGRVEHREQPRTSQHNTGRR